MEEEIASNVFLHWLELNKGFYLPGEEINMALNSFKAAWSMQQTKIDILIKNRVAVNE